MNRFYLLTVLFIGLFLLITGCESQLTSPESSSMSPQADVASESISEVPLSACDVVVPDDASTVQSGVHAASPGETVCVKAGGGPYPEQVIITKDLTLQGLNQPTILAPDNPADFTIAESGPTWEPIVFAFGGTTSGTDGVPEVSGAATVDVSITGVTVDGRGQQPEVNRSVGIFFRNVQSSGGITNNTVENMGVGGKETFGILAYGDTDATIADNTVQEYERGGIGANGDNGPLPDPEVTITENTVTGSGGIKEAWGPNGIQLGYGAAGQITSNVVADNRYGDSYAAATSAGIIVFGSSEVTVRGNQVTNSDIGLATAAAGNNKLTRNDVRDAIVGAFLVQVDNNKLTNNLLSDPEGGPEGIVGVLNTGTNNKLINNTIEGFEDEVVDYGTDSKIHATSP